MSVITISRQLGSLGEYIGLGLAAALGWRYVDRTTIHRAATAAGVPPMALAELAYEGRRSLLERLVNALHLEAAVPPLPESGAVEPLSNPLRLTPLLPPLTTTMQDYVTIVGELICTMADEGQVVIVGRAAQSVLAGRRDTFHAQVVAPFELRVARQRARYGEPRAIVTERLRASDNARADYLRRYYNIDWRDPLLYDMIVNTAQLNAEAAIKLIALGWNAKCTQPPENHQATATAQGSTT